MDTTTGIVGSGGEDHHPYVSCIRVNGAPILPPLLNKGQRNEMRIYRQLAIEKEEFLRTRRTKDRSQAQLMPLETGAMKKGEVLKPIPPSPSGSTQERIVTAGGLSKFQNKIQKINPSLLKHPADIRSPLLKGLVFPHPLKRSTIVRKFPSQVYDSLMKMKFAKMTAAVKGYLTRRLLNTEKVQIIIQTIRDTVELLLNLYEENPPNIEGTIDIKEKDQYLHHRLVQQLTGACYSFHDLFFKISVKEKMAIIANDREKIRAKALKNVLTRHMPLSPSKRNISSATLRSMERRQTQRKVTPTEREQTKRTKPNLLTQPHKANF